MLSIYVTFVEFRNFPIINSLLNFTSHENKIFTQIHFSIFYLLSSIILKSQEVVAPGFTIALEAPVNPIVVDPPIYIPPATNKTASAVIIDTYDESFVLAYKPAVDRACDIVETYIESGVPIKIHFTSSLDGLGNLAETTIPEVAANFNSLPGFPDVTATPYQNNTYYVAAVANNMWSEDRYTNEEGEYAVEIHINASYGEQFYTGTDGNAVGKYDLVTLIIHEILHGLGMFSGIEQTSPGVFRLKFHPPGDNPALPLSLSRHIKNATSNVFATSPDLGDFSEALSTFLQSDDLVFAGPFINDNGTQPKIYAPNPFELGRSIDHLDKDTYAPEDITTENIGIEALMTPFVRKGLAIHDIGPFPVNILKDIGWGEFINIPTGMDDDYFYLMSSTACAGFSTNKLTPGNIYPFTVCQEGYNSFFDAFNWTLEVYYKDESNNMSSYELVNTSGGNHEWSELQYYSSTYTYDMYIPDLPLFTNGNTWLRNMDGTLKAKLRVGYGIVEEDVKIVYPPDSPLTEITTHNCQSATLDFYSRGASSYNIHYSTTPGAPYENVANVPSGTYIHTFSGLSKFNDYYFIVEAINAEGQSTWGAQVTKNSCCSIQVGVFPNPTMVNLHIRTELEDDDLLTPNEFINIEEVNLYKVTDPNLNVHIEGGDVQEVNVPVYNLPSGAYIIETKSSQCGTRTSQMIKQ